MTHYQIIEKAIEYIGDNFKKQPDLDEISKAVGLSPFHFQKIFKEWAGISPKKFLQVLTLNHCKQVLDSTKDILDATYESGLSSTSRIHDLFVNIEAVTPKEYKTMGNGLEISYGFHQGPFGETLIGITDKGICGIFFKQKSKAQTLEKLKEEWPKARLIENQKKTKKYFDQIFHGSKQKIPIFIKGTNFQVQVWKALLQIPEGKLVSYEQIAKKINNEKALRAVGTAIGKNPISYLIPCHRVINKIGKIGNYGGGRLRKRVILGKELATH